MSYCANGMCVDVTARDGMVLVRDTKLDDSPVIAYTETEWQQLVDDTRSGLLVRGHFLLWHRRGVCLEFDWPEIRTFLARVRAGELDVDALRRTPEPA